MINIHSFQFNPFQENTYVVWDQTKEAVVVDAGNYSAGEDRTLNAFIQENELRVVKAINTHGHVDHILGVNYVRETYGVPFEVNEKDRFLVESAPQHGMLYGFRLEAVPEIDSQLPDEGEIRFGNTSLRIIHTPGHTPGHVCFYEPESKTLFTGDTLFRESIGRTDLPGGDYSWIMRSILEKIMPLGADVTIYPGHGPKSDLGHEAAYNPFIVEVLRGEVDCGR